METVLAITVGILFATSAYLIMGVSMIRVVIGIGLLGNAANLLIFTAGRVTRAIPPIVPEGADTPGLVFANPLPQALILTAIVISFALFAFILVLIYRAYEELGTDISHEMRLAEPPHDAASNHRGSRL